MDAARQGAAAASSARGTSGRWQPVPACLAPARHGLFPRGSLEGCRSPFPTSCAPTAGATTAS